MPSIGIEVRPAIIGALVLTLGLAMSLECVARNDCKPSLAIVRMPRPVIVPMKLPPPSAASLDILTPPDHADARPWPYGMVITPPVTHDRILVVLPGPLDKVLSALLGTWLAQPT